MRLVGFKMVVVAMPDRQTLQGLLLCIFTGTLYIYIFIGKPQPGAELGRTAG